MATDVLRTGDNYDLHPYDGFADDNLSAELLAQHLRDAINTFRGEYVLNPGWGIDWLDIKQNKLRSVDALAEQLRTFLAQIPSFSGVQVTSAAQVGRTVTLSLSGPFSRVLGDAQVFLAQPTDGQPGANATAHVTFSRTRR